MTTTTLTADQSGDSDDAGYVLAYVAAAGPRERDFLIQIGSELEYVEWRGDQHTRPWQVVRGYLGTAVASHSSGATVTLEPSIGSGGGGVSVAIATLTDAQIKTLRSTPVEIIPAPGAGKWIVPILAVYRLDWTADYTNIDAACALDLAIGGSGLMNTLANSNLSGVSSLLAGGGPDGSWAVAGPKQPIAYSVPNDPHNHAINADSGWYDSDVENRPMRLTAVSQGSDFTGGDPANTLTVTVTYAVVSF